MNSLDVFHQPLLRPRFSVLRGHLVPHFLHGAPCKFLERLV